MSNRKEEILIVALHLFARDGYEAVSVSQIAGELGMTKGALYRHYKSKRDIFDCIVQRMEQQDREQASDYDMPEEDREEMPEKYEAVSLDDFAEYSKSMFEYWTEDDFASSFRKMLTIEQFRSGEMQKLYQQYLAAGPVSYVKDLLESMGIAEAKDRAVKFYAVMYLYYSVYDGADDKEKVKEEFEAAGELYISTEDGSVGTKGNVMDAIREQKLEADIIYACGPTPMLRAIKQYAEANNIECYISLEERMACGIGACLACVCKSKEKDAHSNVNNKRICKDGPVFLSTEVEI